MQKDGEPDEPRNDRDEASGFIDSRRPLSSSGDSTLASDGFVCIGNDGYDLHRLLLSRIVQLKSGERFLLFAKRLFRLPVHVGSYSTLKQNLRNPQIHFSASFFTTLMRNSL